MEAATGSSSRRWMGQLATDATDGVDPEEAEVEEWWLAMGSPPAARRYTGKIEEEWRWGAGVWCGSAQLRVLQSLKTGVEYMVLGTGATCQRIWRIYGCGYHFFMPASRYPLGLESRPHPCPQVETQTHIRTHRVLYLRARRYFVPIDIFNPA